ncbi:SDR family NAD(P)-dependent oxidoreductase [Flavobacterium yafengii]|uniref:SDR family NAD(P)-dependent oxidoreductase n=1 Tax=Flavobacterium yafengii TaxID=3041253 RepID=UPI0024A81A59|nr:SDR family oxidoreductase [Flavobacterium yafengii]MDI6046665.1 SDR family oxidoreductase [Flavobacterium yafengii]
MDVEKLIILITGTRKGIGNQLAKYYLDKEHMVVGCSRSQSDLEHENYSHYCLDVSNEEQVNNLFMNIRKTYGRLDVLINNAGMASMNHTILTPLSTVNKLFDTNFVGTFLFSRQAIKLMQKYKFGRIINFSTVAVPLNLEGEAIYAASKVAIEQFTKILSKEVGSMGITVNTIGPTPVETDLIKAVPKNKIDELLGQQAIKRLGTFEDIINVVDFYINSKSNFISGQTIYLGGVFK